MAVCFRDRRFVWVTISCSFRPTRLRLPFAVALAAVDEPLDEWVADPAIYVDALEGAPPAARTRRQPVADACGVIHDAAGAPVGCRPWHQYRPHPRLTLDL